MTAWIRDKCWSDAFLPEIKQICGLYLIGEPPQEEDAERNTDLMVLKMDAIRIGCRVRQHRWLGRYADEFTIRQSRPSGVKTELEKLMRGWGDYFFYGFAGPSDEPPLSAWALCRLEEFRIWYNRELYKGNHPGKENGTIAGDATFLAFSLTELPDEFVVARKVKDVQ